MEQETPHPAGEPVKALFEHGASEGRLFRAAPALRFMWLFGVCEKARGGVTCAERFRRALRANTPCARGRDCGLCSPFSPFTRKNHRRKNKQSEHRNRIPSGKFNGITWVQSGKRTDLWALNSFTSKSYRGGLFWSRHRRNIPPNLLAKKHTRQGHMTQTATT